MRAVEFGRCAYRDGLPRDANPYDDKRKRDWRLTWSRAWMKAWNDGWDDEEKKKSVALSEGAP